ncbi:MAG: hydroxymethylbilane synthase [Nocardioidaceae bacterium]
MAHVQSAAVAGTLSRISGLEVELVDIVTGGDTTSAPLAEIGGQGVFVSAVRQALAEGRVDLAVHSLKDLPTEEDSRVTLAAVPPRGDPRDALVARDRLTLAGLPPGSRVGTGSPRRAAQLRALGLGLEVVPIRGNVDTRLAMVASGRIDAVVVARAGLVRLDRADEITEVLDPIQMLPAPGQGALAVEVAVANRRLVTNVSDALDDVTSRAAVVAERAVLRVLEAGCSAPVGALAIVVDGDEGPELSLQAAVCALDGSQAVRLTRFGALDDPAGLGQRLGAELLDQGAATVMQEAVS